jgi:hypothetical protein
MRRPASAAVTAARPQAGDTIMHCGHVEGTMHWFQYAQPLRFQRPDRSRGESSWFAACEACFVAHGAEVVSRVRGDVPWTGAPPALEKVEH